MSGHEVQVVPGVDDPYMWVCRCGDSEEWRTYTEAHEGGEHHLLVTVSQCAGLAPGEHWADLVAVFAHELAGDGNEPFPEHLTSDDIHDLFMQARSMLAAQPRHDLICGGCREWERNIGIDKVGG